MKFSVNNRIKAGLKEGTPIGDGWMPIVIELDEKLADLDPDYKMASVKEKFGVLRVGTEMSVEQDQTSSTLWDEFYDTVQEYEDKTFTMCEECGGIGQLVKTDTGWLKTRCLDHSEDTTKLDPNENPHYFLLSAYEFFDFLKDPSKDI